MVWVAFPSNHSPAVFDHEFELKDRRQLATLKFDSPDMAVRPCELYSFSLCIPIAKF